MTIAIDILIGFLTILLLYKQVEAQKKSNEIQEKNFIILEETLNLQKKLGEPKPNLVVANNPTYWSSGATSQIKITLTNTGNTDIMVRSIYLIDKQLHDLGQYAHMNQILPSDNENKILKPLESLNLSFSIENLAIGKTIFLNLVYKSSHNNFSDVISKMLDSIGDLRIVR